MSSFLGSVWVRVCSCLAWRVGRVHMMPGEKSVSAELKGSRSDSTWTLCSDSAGLRHWAAEKRCSHSQRWEFEKINKCLCVSRGVFFLREETHKFGGSKRGYSLRLFVSRPFRISRLVGSWI